MSLVDVGDRGEKEIAMARFVVIKGVEAVYALKTLEEGTFCGLVRMMVQ